MSESNPCFSCRREFIECPYYPRPNNDSTCDNYLPPIDNSKMFWHWYTWKGRIGRLEYLLTISIIFLTSLISTAIFVSIAENHDIPSRIMQYVIISIFLISRYLIIVAGIKRCHDSRANPIYAYLISCLSFSPFGIIGAVAAFYLFIQKGEDEINIHGTIPQQPYNEQILTTD